MLKPRSPAFVALLGALTALAAISIDMSLAALPLLARLFETTPERTQLTLTLFLIGFGSGQLVVGPMSDRFGRRPVILGGLVVYVIAAVGCAISPGIGVLIAFRLLQGLGASIGRVLSAAIVRDLFSQREGAELLSTIMLVMAVAPLVAPLAGGYLLVWASWPAIFWLQAAAGAVLLAASAAGLPETLAAKNPSALRPGSLAAGIRAFLASRSTIGFAIVAACLYGSMFAYISNSSFVLIEVFGVAPADYGWFFVMGALCLMGGSTLNKRLVRRFDPIRVAGVGLWLAGAASLALIAGTATGSRGALGIALVVGPVFAMCVSMALVIPNATAAALEPLKHVAGLASSLLGFLQMIAGSAVGYLVSAAYSGTPWAMTIGIAAMGLSALAIHQALGGGRAAATAAITGAQSPGMR